MSMININTFLIILTLAAVVREARELKKSPNAEVLKALANARQRAVVLEAALGNALRNNDMLISKLPPGRKIEVKAKRSKSTVMTLNKRKK